jgi:hypothetical protein
VSRPVDTSERWDRMRRNLRFPGYSDDKVDAEVEWIERRVATHTRCQELWAELKALPQAKDEDEWAARLQDPRRGLHAPAQSQL